MTCSFELRDVDKGYSDIEVFCGACASFDSGCVHVVTGASGAGKTTLLRLLMGLETADKGEVVGPLGTRFAATFQEDRLLEGLTATANIRLVHGRLAGEAKDAFLECERSAMAAVGLPLVAKPVRDLSGGQRRRVAILRSVLADADVIFLDEPLKGMDENTVEKVMSFVVPSLSGRTVFWVTHDASEVRWFEDCVLWQVCDKTVVRM